MGDPIRLVMLKAITEEVRSKDLLSQFRESGKALTDGLLTIEVYIQTPLYQYMRTLL